MILDILLMLLLTLLLVGLFTLLTPNRWSKKNVPFHAEYPAVVESDITPHGALMDAIRKTRQ